MVARWPKTTSTTLSIPLCENLWKKFLLDLNTRKLFAASNNSVVYLLYGQKECCTSYFLFLVWPLGSSEANLQIIFSNHAAPYSMSVTDFFSTFI